jgi:hypothetical protein
MLFLIKFAKNITSKTNINNIYILKLVVIENEKREAEKVFHRGDYIIALKKTNISRIRQ